LRIAPEEPSLQAAAREAAKQTQLAAASARADLVEGAKAAEESVKNIRNSLQDAVLAQQSLAGGDQGLNAFIPGQAAYNRQAQANAELQAATRAAKQDFINSLGPNADPAVANAVNRREFSGTLAEQNAQMVQFIESIRQEIRGAQGIDDLNQQLVKAQNDLVTINTALRDVNEQVYNAVNALAEKNWTVNVNVPGGSASGDVVGAVNSRS
jgi:DNA repair exonuclease SbcCD ATPase subunit